jgi:hypothetical protein
MESTGHAEARSLKERAWEEFKAYWLITVYLWVFLGSFTIYRRLILAETGVPYLHYGIALVEAMIIAKVLLIGRIFGFTRRFDHLPLVVPVVYKSLLFALLVLGFGVLEKTVDGLIHREGVLSGLQKIAEVGRYEIGARTLMLTVALVPFCAFSELGRVIGLGRLGSLFFGRREAAAEAKP